MAKCALELCTRRARFDIKRLKTQEWLQVCASHDNYLGLQNLELLGIPHREAARIVQELKNTEEEI